MKDEKCQDEGDLLHRALLEYADSQQHYLEGMRRGDTAKLKEWTEDVYRSEIFLKQIFVKVGKSYLNENKRIGLCRIFAKIRRQSDELRKLMVAKSQQMAAEIPRLRRGKMALQGYSLANNAGQVFLSSKG